MPPIPDDELISAYLDDELSRDDRLRAEQLLLDRADLRRLFEELRGLRDGLRGLPKFSLGEEFSSDVLRKAERSVLQSSLPTDETKGSSTDEKESTNEPAPNDPIAVASPTSATSTTSSATTPAPPIPRDHSLFSRPIIWSLTAVAAALALMIYGQGGFRGDEAQMKVAQAPTGAKDAAVPPVAPATTTEGDVEGTLRDRASPLRKSTASGDANRNKAELGAAVDSAAADSSGTHLSITNSVPSAGVAPSPTLASDAVATRIAAKGAAAPMVESPVAASGTYGGFGYANAPAGEPAGPSLESIAQQDDERGQLLVDNYLRLQSVRPSGRIDANELQKLAAIDQLARAGGSNALGGNAMSGNAMSGNAMSGNAMSGNAMSGNAMSGNAMSGNAMPGNAMSGNAMPGSAMLGNLAQGNSMQAVPAPTGGSNFSMMNGTATNGTATNGTIPGGAASKNAGPSVATPNDGDRGRQFAGGYSNTQQFAGGNNFAGNVGNHFGGNNLGSDNNLLVVVCDIKPEAVELAFAPTLRQVGISDEGIIGDPPTDRIRGDRTQPESLSAQRQNLARQVESEQDKRRAGDPTSRTEEKAMAKSPAATPTPGLIAAADKQTSTSPFAEGKSQREATAGGASGGGGRGTGSGVGDNKSVAVAPFERGPMSKPGDFGDGGIRTEFTTRDAEGNEFLFYYVVASREQLESMLRAFRSDPKLFLNVSVDPANTEVAENSNWRQYNRGIVHDADPNTSEKGLADTRLQPPVPASKVGPAAIAAVADPKPPAAPSGAPTVAGVPAPSVASVPKPTTPVTAAPMAAAPPANALVSSQPVAPLALRSQLAGNEYEAQQMQTFYSRSRRVNAGPQAARDANQYSVFNRASEKAAPLGDAPAQMRRPEVAGKNSDAKADEAAKPAEAKNVRSTTADALKKSDDKANLTASTPAGPPAFAPALPMKPSAAPATQQLVKEAEAFKAKDGQAQGGLSQPPGAPAMPPRTELRPTESQETAPMLPTIAPSAQSQILPQPAPAPEQVLGDIARQAQPIVQQEMPLLGQSRIRGTAQDEAARQRNELRNDSRQAAAPAADYHEALFIFRVVKSQAAAEPQSGEADLRTKPTPTPTGR